LVTARRGACQFRPASIANIPQIIASFPASGSAQAGRLRITLILPILSLSASKETTKSKRTLRARLNQHVGKIRERQNITLADMKCRYLTFDSEWWVFATEFALMAHYQPEWNASGFGSKVPGKGRPGTHRASRWNELFPKR